MRTFFVLPPYEFSRAGDISAGRSALVVFVCVSVSVIRTDVLSYRVMI